MIDRGWMMFDLMCKPTNRPRTTFYDKSKKLYFNIKSKWTKEKLENDIIKPFLSTEKNYIRIAVMTDIFDKKSGIIYLFQSFLNIDREDWELCGFYVFTNEAPVPIITSYIVTDQGYQIAEVSELLSKMFKGDEIREIRMVSNRFEILSEVEIEDQCIDTILIALGLKDKIKIMNKKEKITKMNKSLNLSTYLDSMSFIKGYLWSMGKWLSGGDSMLLIEILNRYGMYKATRQLVECRGIIFVSFSEKIKIAELLILIDRHSSSLKQIREEIRNQLTLTSLVKILKLIDSKENSYASTLCIEDKNNLNINSHLDALYSQYIKIKERFKL